MKSVMLTVELAFGAAWGVVPDVEVGGVTIEACEETEVV
jgi:hypothetical protein